MADVAHEFALEIGHGSKYAASDHITLDLREPQFDLIEPRRVGGSEVHMNISMFGQEFRDALSLVRREIVCNDVDFFALGLVHHDIVEKRHELGRGMPLRRLSQHLPRSWY